MPQIFKLARVICPNDPRGIDLLNGQDSSNEMQDFCKYFIIENIKKKNANLLLGEIVACPASMKGKLLCFELSKESLDNDLYITIVSKNLDFIYSHSIKLSNFHNVTAIQNYPYTPTHDPKSKNISVMLLDDAGNFLEENLYNKITANGNLIFLHPHQ